jgi:hypothetical protein
VSVVTAPDLVAIAPDYDNQRDAQNAADTRDADYVPTPGVSITMN